MVRRGAGTAFAEGSNTTMDSPQFHEARRAVLVVTVDAARARLFWLEPSRQPRAQFELREDEQAFVHPEGRMRPGELYTDSFSGGVRSPTGAHLGFDDHQNQKDEEQRKRFAREVADGLATVVRERDVDRLVLAASHAQHSLLVGELEKKKLACSLRHLPLEVTTLSPTELYKALDAHELLR